MNRCSGGIPYCSADGSSTNLPAKGEVISKTEWMRGTRELESLNWRRRRGITHSHCTVALGSTANTISKQLVTFLGKQLTEREKPLSGALESKHENLTHAFHQDSPVDVVWEVGGYLTSAPCPTLFRVNLQIVLLEIRVIKRPFRLMIFLAVVWTRLLVAEPEVVAL